MNQRRQAKGCGRRLHWLMLSGNISGNTGIKK